MSVSLNDLQALALALPPSERVPSGAVGDVVSALIAVAQHGEGIIDAAKEGKIADFYHDLAVKHAADNGHPEPVRGSVPTEQPTSGQAAPVQDAATHKRLTAVENALAEILAAVRGEEQPAAPVAPTAPVAPDSTVPVAGATASDSTTTEATTS